MDDDLFAMMQSLDETPQEREEYIRAPFPYVGAKNRSLNNLLQHLPYTDTWIDGFGGSGAVTLGRRRCRFEVFNDRHSGIISFYRCFRERDKKDQLLERLKLTVHSREEYIWSHETWEHNTLDDVERAARWYYSIVYSFGGIGRNFGRSITDKVIMSGKIHTNLELFENIHDRFRNIQVENLDWKNVLIDYDNEDAVIYLDPPYYGKNCYKHIMSHSDHIEMCHRIFNCKGFIALSGYNNPVYDKFPWDRKESWPAHVSVTTKATETNTSNVTRIGTDAAVECLWIKEPN